MCSTASSAQGGARRSGCARPGLDRLPAVGRVHTYADALLLVVSNLLHVLRGRLTRPLRLPQPWTPCTPWVGVAPTTRFLCAPSVRPTAIPMSAAPRSCGTRIDTVRFSAPGARRGREGGPAWLLARGWLPHSAPPA